MNARSGIERADITSVRWSGKTVKGAKRWADKQLADVFDARPGSVSEGDRLPGEDWSACLARLNID